MPVSRVLQEEMKYLEWVRVESSNLEEVAYVDGLGALWVRFHRKLGSKTSYSVYRYDYVPRSVYESLLSAASHGSYFAKHIKHVYQFIHVM